MSVSTAQGIATMIKYAAAVFALALGGLTACGDSGGKAQDKSVEESSPAKTGNAGPDRTEGHLDEAQMAPFSEFLPADVGGWKKQPRLGYYSGSDQSTATATYRRDEGGESFSVVITFSNNMVGQTQAILNNPSQAETWGFEIGMVGGYPALLGKSGTNMAGTPYLIVLSNSRSVQVLYNAQGAVTLDMIRPVAEKIDLKSIAQK